MMSLSELWRYFKLLSPQNFTREEAQFLEGLLPQEYALKEQKKREHLLRMSGIKKVQLLADFDWTFNPKIPREKIMEFTNTDWLKKPCNLVLVGPSGIGKTHIASALCYDAVIQGKQTIFLTLFDLTAKLSKARSVYSLIDYYGKVPILCLDELGYVLPTREHTDCLFQIISKRTETGTTIVTTNLVPSQWGHPLEGTLSRENISPMQKSFLFLQGDIPTRQLIPF
ncbi:MAG: ATP-binding protein [Proteobacteria bacterium]|nr:ATP-binding protein [Pseudomonadota bacterium]